MDAEREGWRRAPPTLCMSHADIRRRTSAWPPLAGVLADWLSAHGEAPHLKGLWFTLVACFCL